MEKQTQKKFDPEEIKKMKTEKQNKVDSGEIVKKIEEAENANKLVEKK